MGKAFDNSTAIACLLAANKALAADSTSSAGAAFAIDLVRILEQDKTVHLTIADDSYEVSPRDVNVMGLMVAFGDPLAGGTFIELSTLQGGTDGEYELIMLVDEVNLLAETMQVRLGTAAQLAAAA